MLTPPGFDALLDEVCVKLGYCGSVKDGERLHVTKFIPNAGMVTADQFVEWVFLADGQDPNIDLIRWQPHKTLIRAAFVDCMGGESVDASLLRWD